MEEESWTHIEGFPDYIVSNLGMVCNESTGKVIRQSLTRNGVVKVNLYFNHVCYTRSVAVLVAEAYVLGRTEIFDTPVHLDGDPTNNVYYNLMWRPRWFAWKYKRQFSETFVGNLKLRIQDLESGVIFENSFDAAVSNGLLVEDVWRSAVRNEPTPITHHRFGLVPKEKVQT